MSVDHILQLYGSTNIRMYSLNKQVRIGIAIGKKILMHIAKCKNNRLTIEEQKNAVENLYNLLLKEIRLMLFLGITMTSMRPYREIGDIKEQ